MFFLIDTNILVPLEPVMADDFEVNTLQAMDFFRLVHSSKNTICIHPNIEYDLLRDRNIGRSELRKTLIRRYKILESPPSISILDADLVGNTIEGSNDYVDNCLIAAVKGNAVDFLVSEDKKLHRKARRVGIESRVLYLYQAIDLLLDFFDRSPPPPPSVEKVFVYELNEKDPIFHSLIEDYYPDFERWLNKCKRDHREAYIIPAINSNWLSGICIIKRENQLPTGHRGKTLKLCTFKVSENNHGQRYGELLLKAIFEYADSNRYDYLYFTAFRKREELIAFAESFGFRIFDQQNKNDELIIYKILNYHTEHYSNLSPLEFHIRYGPRKVLFENNSTFAVPIKPSYHAILFPELESQKPLFLNSHPCGNSIKKAYLCHSPCKQICPGDNLLIYRSKDVKGFTAIGAVEDTLVSSDPNEIARYVGTRTVYNFHDIVTLCNKPTLAIRFRLAKRIDPIISLNAFKKPGHFKGAPQSITRLREESIEWIQKKLNM